MKRIAGILSHLTFANVMSVVAVFIALGGAGYAAVNLPKNSVGTKQLKGKSVGKKQLKGNAVNSNKVKDFSLRANDFKRGQIPSGATGATGATGPRGVPGLSGLEAVSTQSSLNSDSPKVISATCPEGKRAISAGYDLSGGKTGDPPAPYSNLVADSVNVLPSSASLEAYEIGSGTTGAWRVTLVVNCATVP